MIIFKFDSINLENILKTIFKFILTIIGIKRLFDFLNRILDEKRTVSTSLNKDGINIDLK